MKPGSLHINRAYNLLTVGYSYLSYPSNISRIEGAELTYHHLHLAGNTFEAVQDVVVM